jgi:hypothetical protein
MATLSIRDSCTSIARGVALQILQLAVGFGRRANRSRHSPRWLY